MNIFESGLEILFPEGEPTSVTKCFRALQVSTVGDLCQYTKQELSKRKIRKITINKIEQALACYNTGLKPSEMDEEREAIWEVEIGNSDKKRYPVDCSFNFGANVA